MPQLGRLAELSALVEQSLPPEEAILKSLPI